MASYRYITYINSDLPIKKELLHFFESNTPLIIFDIGACEGEDSIRYSRLFPNAKVYLFEPLPENFEICLHNLSEYSSDRIFPYQLALSSKDGSAIFYVSEGNPEGTNKNEWNYGNKSSSLYQPDPSYKIFEWLKFEKKIEVKTKKLASFCNENSILEIDYIHMDVQGAELDVLKGAGAILKSIKIVWLEVENVAMYCGQPLRREIEMFMKESNFIKVLDTAINDSGDQLYINRQYYSFFSFFVLKEKFLIVLKKIYAKIYSTKRIY